MVQHFLRQTTTLVIRQQKQPVSQIPNQEISLGRVEMKAHTQGSSDTDKFSLMNNERRTGFGFKIYMHCVHVQKARYLTNTS